MPFAVFEFNNVNDFHVGKEDGDVPVFLVSGGDPRRNRADRAADSFWGCPGDAIIRAPLVVHSTVPFEPEDADGIAENSGDDRQDIVTAGIRPRGEIGVRAGTYDPLAEKTPAGLRCCYPKPDKRAISGDSNGVRRVRLAPGIEPFEDGADNPRDFVGRLERDMGFPTVGTLSGKQSFGKRFHPIPFLFRRHAN